MPPEVIPDDDVTRAPTVMLLQRAFRLKSELSQVERELQRRGESRRYEFVMGGGDSEWNEPKQNS